MKKTKIILLLFLALGIMENENIQNYKIKFHTTRYFKIYVQNNNY
jgi:hypothetical protein